MTAAEVLLPPARRLPPEAAVPAGRIGYDLSAARLLLHTVIDEDGYEMLRATGIVRADPSRTHPDDEQAHGFMRAEHRRRVPGSTGGPLLWAWARTTRRHLVEATREAALWRERPQVLLTCRVPRARVLLSEFVAWHAVLGRWLVVDDLPPQAQQAALDAFDEERERYGLDHVPVEQWPPAVRDRVQRSWQRIFDQRVHPRGSTWQGCVEHLERRDVVDAVAICLRSRPGSPQGSAPRLSPPAGSRPAADRGR